MRALSEHETRLDIQLIVSIRKSMTTVLEMGSGKKMQDWKSVNFIDLNSSNLMFEEIFQKVEQKNKGVNRRYDSSLTLLGCRPASAHIYIFLINLFFGLMACGDLISPTRDQTLAPCSGRAESYPLCHQGSPCPCF